MKRTKLAVLVFTLLLAGVTAGTVFYYNGQKGSLSESLMLIDNDWGFHAVGEIYEWNFTAVVKNNGSVTAIIRDIAINGQSYTSMDPVPTVSPSIENGCSLAPNQTITITIRNSNSTSQPFGFVSGKIYLMTEAGNSYLIYEYAS